MILPDTERRRSAHGPTHAVDILAFVEAQGIPCDYFETPYYLAPVPGGESAYAQLREELRRSKKIGIAYVEIHARQHLAALVPQGQVLVLNTLRWASEAGSAAHFGMPEADLAAAQELAMMTPPGSAMLIPATHEETFPSALAELAELAECTMKHRRTPDTLAEEADADYLQDDEDAASDDYLAAVFSRRPHPADGNAVRRRRPARRRQRTRGRRTGARRG